MKGFSLCHSSLLALKSCKFKAVLCMPLHLGWSRWFCSEMVHFLLNRLLSVNKIESTLSDVCKLLFVIPQGSVLGPLLFSLYTIPLNLVIGKNKGIKFHFYANDSKVYVYLSQKNASAAFEHLNRYLDDVKE